MEYNQFGEYELDEDIEIEDLGDVEEFFEDPAIQFMKTKSIDKIWNQWSHVIFENLNCKIASSIQFISCALLRVLLGEVPFYHESVVYIVTY